MDIKRRAWLSSLLLLLLISSGKWIRRRCAICLGEEGSGSVDRVWIKCVWSRETLLSLTLALRSYCSRLTVSDGSLLLLLLLLGVKALLTDFGEAG